MRKGSLGKRDKNLISATLPSDDALREAALDTRQQAYAPYSNFAVGAALLCDDGRIFCGANVENISFGLTVCAERSALFAAVAGGARKFVRIAVVADSMNPVSPCGACRQVLAEFAEDLEVLSYNLAGNVFRGRLAELLPRAKVGILEKGCST